MIIREFLDLDIQEKKIVAIDAILRPFRYRLWLKSSVVYIATTLIANEFVLLWA